MDQAACKAVDPHAPAIEAKNLGKVYPDGTRALKGVSLKIARDQFMVVIGLSGAGKSTMLRCFNRLIQPTEGALKMFGEDITRVSGSRLRQVRCQAGMIFQQFHLIRRLTALENVMVGRLRFNCSMKSRCLSLGRIFSKEEKDKAFECMKQVGIGELAYRRADTLSGGQQQRVAIARALAQNPQVFLADEPIASLDPRSSEVVMNTLMQIHQEHGIPVMVNLHHIDFAVRYAKRIVGMAHGEMVFEGSADDLTPETVEMIYGHQAKDALELLSAA